MSRRHGLAIRNSRDRLANEIAEDLENKDAWTKMEAGQPRTLGTQVSIRLDSEDAKKLRQVAHAKAVGYTSLLREWIQERLRAEFETLSTFTYETDGFTSANLGDSYMQVTSGELHIRDVRKRAIA